MTLSIGYIKNPSVSSAGLASLFGHEGQHYLNTGKYSGANLWRGEQSAGRMQLGIGNKLGITQLERQTLENWIDDMTKTVSTCSDTWSNHSLIDKREASCLYSQGFSGGFTR